MPIENLIGEIVVQTGKNVINQGIDHAGNVMKQASGIQDIINGLLLFARGISWLIFAPLKLFGIQLTSTLVQIIYIAILFIVLYKIVGWKIGIGALVLIIILGSIGFT